MTLQELLEERAKLVKEARVILETAETEKRELTAEEENSYEQKMKRVDEIGDKVEKTQKAEDRNKKLKELESRLDESVNDPMKMDPEDNEAGEVRKQKELRDIFRGYLGSTEASTAATYMTRALQMDADTAGGYTVAPQQFIADLLETAKNMVFIRQLATVYSVPKAESLGRPTLDNDVGDPTWTAEILTGDEDTDLSFGKRELFPHPLAKLLKLSKKLIRASALNIDTIIRDRLAYKTSVVEENNYLNGNGNNKPLGVFVASSEGISTSRDVSTDNTTTAIKPDNLIECKYTLKGNYWRAARWIFHRDAVKKIRKLKDGEGQYLWRPGLQADRGDTILDLPVIMSEYAPNTFTTGQYVGILGDFSYYWIADALDMTIQVLVEKYAEKNQNGYILRKESDGMPALEEAFVRVKLA